MKYYFENLNQSSLQNLIGINDANLEYLETLYDCGIVFRDNYFKLLTDDEKTIDTFKRHMDVLCKASVNQEININYIKQSYLNLDKTEVDFSNQVIAYGFNGKPYKFKTYHQFLLGEEIKKNDLIILEGPAGTGKTFLAVLFAIKALKNNEISKIIITRPAVEAGESLGFLPGDLKEKIDPYLMPIYDALDEILGSELKDRYLEKEIIQVIPLAYMRGRTLDDSFVILDEAQNTTDKQMLMFLTRLGFNSKMLVNGDLSQIDLNFASNRCGLLSAINKLKDIKGVSIFNFTNDDVVRNPLVTRIIERFKIN